MASSSLVTFSGKFGDILWSLATAKAIAGIVGDRVDFACMPQYKSLLPLIEDQDYVAEAKVFDDWIMLHSNHGDQPWHPPIHHEKGYERVWHLGYRGHPGLSGQPNMSLIDFTAHQQGIRFVENPLPFLKVEPVKDSGTYVAYAFNEQYADLKGRFLHTLQNACPELEFIDSVKFSWRDAPALIAGALCFVGCRSANYVIAHGVAQRIICYEPHPARHAQGHLGTVFGCPYGREWDWPFPIPPEQQAQMTASKLNELLKEKTNEVPETSTR